MSVRARGHRLRLRLRRRRHELGQVVCAGLLAHGLLLAVVSLEDGREAGAADCEGAH
jgi:hypothetical protein